MSKLQAPTREPFRWLFTAEFEDGSKVEQDMNDTCHCRTDGTGSAFTDVLEREKTSPVTAFHLYNVNGREAVSVDLRTGAFIVNGTPINIHEQHFAADKHQLKLVYFRETRVDNDVKATVEDDGSVTQSDGFNARHYVNRYFIGWDVVGKNKQAILAVG